MATEQSKPRLAFDVDTRLQEWNVSAKEWLEQHKASTGIDGLAVATAVFNSDNRLLIVQRAAHDSMPGRWELPGGAVDEDDSTILYGAAREFVEEAGLLVKNFTRLITEGPGAATGYVFTTARKGMKICRFTFGAEVEDTTSVLLDPNEHQQYIWATEDEVRHQYAEGRDIPITTPSMASTMLEAFRLRSEAAER